MKATLTQQEKVQESALELLFFKVMILPLMVLFVAVGTHFYDFFFAFNIFFVFSIYHYVIVVPTTASIFLFSTVCALPCFYGSLVSFLWKAFNESKRRISVETRKETYQS